MNRLSWVIESKGEYFIKSLVWIWKMLTGHQNQGEYLQLFDTTVPASTDAARHPGACPASKSKPAPSSTDDICYSLGWTAR
jgi:hypothetical protein